MRRLLIVLASSLLCLGLSAKTVSSFILTDGGPGPYKAEIALDSGLPGYTIIKPANLKAVTTIEGKLPVVLFGNGGCSRDAAGFYQFLTNIASQGYIVITNGTHPDAPAPKVKKDAKAPAQPQAAPGDMMAGFKLAEAQNVIDAKDYLNAYKWLVSESLNKKSEYYGAVDAQNVAAMGQSCGGLQALIMSTEEGSPVKTTIVLNSGVTYLDNGKEWMIEKAKLVDLPGPILYLIGGKEDIAYPNGTDDFKRITHVPVSIGNLPVGHGGTYAKKDGGSFADMAILWLDYQLKGKVENESVFRYCELPADLKKEGWTMHAKNYSQPIEMHLYAPVASKETIRYNDFGEISQYSGVNDPTITVYLPDKDKATGAAVLLYPGGGLMSLSWDGECTEVAKKFNARGIAAVAVKYRLRDMSQMAAGPRPAQPAAQPDNKFLRMQGKIQDFVELEKANCNPSAPDPNDKSNDMIAEDCNRAIELVKAHAKEWNINPDLIGELGFSAGGAVELAGLMKADKDHMPAFIATLYGPSTVDIEVPANAPKLYIAVHADHPNVAAGCLALFMEWKKSGVDAEMHIYEQKTGNFFGSAGSGAGNVDGGDWFEPLYSWMLVNGFTK